MAKKVIRFIEDDAEIIHMLKMVAPEELELRITRNGIEELLSPEKWGDVQVAVVDLHLGGDITGLDVLRWLAEEAPHVRRVVFSAVAELAESHRYAKLAHASVSKPDLPKLWDAVSE